MRAATFVVSPMAEYSMRRSEPTLPTIANPVLRPMRPSMRWSWRSCHSPESARSSAWMSRAARQARAASSSWAMGAPKMAMKPSPANWAITPS
jgi:hypothetical protein